MVAEILKVGRENALSTEYLVAVLNLGSTRSLQKQIELERKHGAVILSSSQAPGGYYLPGSRYEVVEFIRTLENRATETMFSLRSARQLLKEMESDYDACE